MKVWWNHFKTEPLLALGSVPLTVWLTLTALGAIAICLSPKSSSEPVFTGADSQEKVSSLDTFIPQGFVLIPIELENYTSLDSILGSYGVVDLYLSGASGEKKAKPLVRRIKILRAPQNPSQFAVLVPENQAALFFRGHSLFFAAIQNPKKTGISFEETPSKPSQRAVMIFEQENL